jgi:hypothetical protein
VQGDDDQKYMIIQAEQNAIFSAIIGSDEISSQDRAILACASKNYYLARMLQYAIGKGNYSKVITTRIFF